MIFDVATSLTKFGETTERLHQIIKGFHLAPASEQRSAETTHNAQFSQRQMRSAKCEASFMAKRAKKPDEQLDLTDVGGRLKWARLRDGRYKGSATEAAEAFGWTISTYLGHENGDRNPSRAAAQRYADAYGVQWEWLLEGEGNPVSDNVVKVVGKIGAGGWIDPEFEQVPPEGLFEIEVPIEIPRDAVAFQIEGDSMFPRYDDGDVIICWREGTDIHEVIGWEAAVRVADGARYLKRVVQGSTPRTFDLESYNAPPIRGVKLEWVAKVSTVVRRGEWRRLTTKSRKNVVARKLKNL